MAIDKFVYILFSIVLVIQFIKIDDNIVKKDIKEQPTMILNNSTIYSINDKGLEKIIRSKVFSKYKNTEVLEDAIIESRMNDKNTTTLLSANYMTKTNNKIELINNVNYTQGNILSLSTNQLDYDIKNQIATNKVNFYALYNFNEINGTHLYLDIKNNKIKSKNTHFSIENKGN
jgi:hypothetical protein